MSITREQLKVGETYVDDSKEEVMVIAVGDKKLFLSSLHYKENCETTWVIEDFLKTYSIKPEPKKIGEVAWFMHKEDDTITATTIGSESFKAFDESEYWQRVTIKDNDIWEFYE